MMNRRQSMFVATNSNDNKQEEGALVKFSRPRVTSGRVKKTKVPFDPSDANYPKRRQTICEQAPAKNSSKVSSSKMVSSSKATRTQAILQPCCSSGCILTSKSLQYVKCAAENDCPKRIHLNCLKESSTNFSKNEELNWRCENCETCGVCYETAFYATLYKCYVCMSVFHMACHDTEITDDEIVFKNRFRCSQCVMRAPNTRPRPSPQSSDNVTKSRRNSDADFEGFTAVEIKEVVNSGKGGQPEKVLSTVSVALNTATTFDRYPLSFGVTYSEEVPDACDWTPDDVYNYFEQFFDPSVIQVFKEQEIDGSSLLLLKRTDVLTRLNMKLGIALRVYSHVLRLQTRINDVRMGWF